MISLEVSPRAEARDGVITVTFFELTWKSNTCVTRDSSEFHVQLSTLHSLGLRKP